MRDVVSWGHFFANNKFGFGETYLSLDSDEIFQNNDVSKVQYVINGKYDPGSCGGSNENGVLVILREFVHSFHSMEH
ncbi:hypothetical protein LR010_03100 [Candidatus Gracilibacteria bacterium]|nr:hypothetical protein [Candidatus Gracilibacteria bacterium]